MQANVDIGTGIMAVEHHGDPASPIDMVFVHANGMNAATYRCIFARLPAAIHVLAIDQRGHGLSQLPAPVATAERTGWSDLRDDLLALLATLDGPPKVLAGHSMGATVSLMAAASALDLAGRLLLFDPVWTQPGSEITIAEVSKNRRRHFAGPDEAFSRLQGRGAFASWPDQALRDYLSTGLRPSPEGYELSCTPEWETSNFLTSVNPLAECLARLSIPTTVLLAQNGSAWQPPANQTYPEAMTIVEIAGSSHFLPIEFPALASARIVDEIAAA